MAFRLKFIMYRNVRFFKLFLLYTNRGDRKAAMQTAKKIVNQSVKKEGTKTLRMKAEVRRYIQENL